MEYRKKPTVRWSISSRQRQIGCVCPKSRVPSARGIRCFCSLAWPSISQIRHFADTYLWKTSRTRSLAVDYAHWPGQLEVVAWWRYCFTVCVIIMSGTSMANLNAIWTDLSVKQFPSSALMFQWPSPYFFFTFYHFSQQLALKDRFPAPWTMALAEPLGRLFVSRGDFSSCPLVAWAFQSHNIHYASCVWFCICLLLVLLEEILIKDTK